ncbi:MAG: carbohydrate kinase [Lentisphaerae bacterium]|nr:carbohydrate kinase [Lentisphaerota bacterium]
MKQDEPAPDSLFLGLDASTQGLKATAIDAQLNVVYEAALNYDSDLPEFGTEGGAHHHDDGLTVTSPAIMWVAALDILLQKLADEKFPFTRVVAVSGSGQQHGSVWLKKGASSTLAGLNATLTLRQQLADIFSVADSPIWMDSSTGPQCRALENALGGPQAVADLTGSRAYERFTGNQVAKLFQQQPDAYESTEHIALVSSFMASLLTGDYVAVDHAEGSGMNLMNIRSKTWDRAALDATAPDLESRLGPLSASHARAGSLHSYYAGRYGFRPDCAVFAFSGDNPNSLAGLRLQLPGSVAISLGTSDTVFASLTDPHPSGLEGHILANPVDPSAYMAMVCYKNGSLTRELVRDQSGCGTWKEFADVVNRTGPGNEGSLGFYLKEPEITPPILHTGVYRFDADGNAVEAFECGTDARAVVEGQFLSMRLHGSKLGIEASSILATGGASGDQCVIRILTDVFGVPVYVGEQPNSASLGAAYRALHGWRCDQEGSFVPFADAVADAPPFQKSADPDPSAHAVYNDLLPRYEALEKKVVEMG